MKRSFLLFLIVLSAEIASSQTIIQRDPVIENLVSQVSADSLKSYVLQMTQFGTRHTMSSTSSGERGIGAARNWVVAQFNRFAKQAAGRLTAYVDTTTLPADGNRIDLPTNLGNAMAILKGTDPADDRIFLISGHLDSRVSNVMNKQADAPGANDDGSGAAAVIECARILSGQAFPATIIFVTVSGEEQGLLGAKFLAIQMTAKKWNLQGMLNNDIMGSNNSSETHIIDNTRVRVFSEGLPAFELDKSAANIRKYGLENDGNSRQLARYVKEVGERYVPNFEVIMVYRNDRYLRGGDHTPFVENGFPAVRITEMNENFDHQHQDVRTENGKRYGDLPEFMDFELLRKNTALNLSCLASLAKSPGKPLDVKIEVAQLTNYTSLLWKAPVGAAPKGYYLLMRQTTSAFWEKKIFTDKTQIRVPYSKDNYFFAVQSVNEAGNESLPVVPVPVNR